MSHGWNKHDNPDRPASPLPWEWLSTVDHGGYAPHIYHSQRSDSRVDGAVADVASELYDADTDARYIVTACNAYPQLLAEVERLRSLVEAQE